MKTSEFLLFVSKEVIQGVIGALDEELAERNADYEKLKRSEELRKGSIDVEFTVVKE